MTTLDQVVKNEFDALRDGDEQRYLSLLEHEERLREHVFGRRRKSIVRFMLSTTSRLQADLQEELHLAGERLETTLNRINRGVVLVWLGAAMIGFTTTLPENEYTHILTILSSLTGTVLGFYGGLDARQEHFTREDHVAAIHELERLLATLAG